MTGQRADYTTDNMGGLEEVRGRPQGIRHDGEQ